MTIGICSVAYGDTYHRFLPEWSQAVASLDTQPTRITIIHDGISQEIKDIVNDNIPVMWLEDRTTTYTFHPQVLINTAITFTKCEWIVKLDADDLILPHALNHVNNSDADVVNFGYRINGREVISQPVTAEQILQRGHNPVSSCSPFRRWLWERNPFRDMVYDDWGFWFEAAREGATFAATGSVDYVYRVHDHQITRQHNAGEATRQVLSL